MIREAILKMSDTNIDKFIHKNWGGKATTFLYDLEASILLAKYVDVIISPDKRYIHIPGDMKPSVGKEIEKIIQEMNLTEIE